MTSPSPYEAAADAAPKPERYLASEPRTYYRDPRLKSPMSAALLSLMPGLGQAFLGYTRLGFLHAAAVASMIALLASNHLGALEPAVGVFMSFFWLYNLVDAYRRAVLLNEAITRMETPELPDAFKALTYQGRVGVGLLLILAGTLSLLSLRFHVSMAWLEQWWPAGVLLFGLYLVVGAIRDRMAEAEAKPN